MLFDYCVLSSIIRNMLKKIILLLITLILFSACNHKEEIYIPVNQEEEEIKEEIVLTKEEEILNSMTLEEKIGQLFIVRYENIDEEVITTIAKQKPYYFVMRDSSMASDSVATNFDQIFATYSPDTVRKVL